MPEQQSEPHVLRQLTFPDRWEPLVELLGAEVAQVVVPPAATTSTLFRTLAEDIRQKRQGAFLPVSADTGTGKTTLSNSLSTFYPTDYRTTVSFTAQQVSFDSLTRVAEAAIGAGDHSDKRILPILVDDRESAPPSRAELAAIKQFVRKPGGIGPRSVVIWPETDDETATEMSEVFEDISGKRIVRIPARIEGPTRDQWQQIATHTLHLANNVSDLPALGVDPANYDPENYSTLGTFLREISNDFTQLRVELLAATERPLRLAIVFASASPDVGALAQLTNQYGLLSGSALISATSKSAIGEFWAKNRGLLTTMIVQYDIRAFSLPPQVTIPTLRHYGPDAIKQRLEALEVKSTLANVRKAWGRSDLGLYLIGQSRLTAEGRGTPATKSTTAFTQIAPNAFNGGRDKELNKATLEAIKDFMGANNKSIQSPKAEKSVGNSPLIPDNSYELDGDVYCLEYTWRSGDFLSPTKQSAPAIYILSKLKEYARTTNRPMQA